MEMLGQYQLVTALSNKDAGSCSWCFAERDGQEYFIKEFMEPKYPDGDTASSPAKREKKRNKCLQFEQKKTRVYQTINENSDGAAVRVTDFFRSGTKYYAVMPRIRGVRMEAEQVATLSERKVRMICAVVAHALAQLHRGKFIHADIKHSNVMLVKAAGGDLTAKLIDYDAGYFEDDPPGHSEEIGGDQVYFAPEVYDAIQGKPIALSRKLDIFSLGILFHQYLTGTLPGFDMNQYSCVGDAVSCGAPIFVSGAMPKDLYDMICSMLDKKPENRPSAQEVYETLIKPLRPYYAPVQTVKEEEDKSEVKIVSLETGGFIPGFVGDAPAKSGWQGLGDL